MSDTGQTPDVDEVYEYISETPAADAGYDFQVVDTRKVTSKSGAGMMAVELQVVGEGEYFGAKHTEMLFLERYFLDRTEAFLAACGIPPAGGKLKFARSQIVGKLVTGYLESDETGRVRLTDVHATDGEEGPPAGEEDLPF